MRRIIVLTLLIISCFLLQTTVFPYFELVGIVPNILLILTMSFGLMRGRREGLLVGFFCGLLFDIFFGFAIGPHALIFMYLGYCNGFFHRHYAVEDILLPAIAIGVNDLIYNLLIYLIFFLMRNRLDFLTYATHTILPEMIYTILVTLFLYKIFVKINRWLRVKVDGGKN